MEPKDCGKAVVVMLDKMSMLLDYTDLNGSQFDDLRQAHAGAKSMNGARRFAMKDLIDEKHVLTAWGCEVLGRGEAILEEGWEPTINDVAIVGPNRAAERIRAGYVGGRWVYVVHVRIMDALWCRPGLCYKRLCGEFGQAAVHEAQMKGVVYGDRKLGAAWNLKLAGERMLDWARRGVK